MSSAIFKLRGDTLANWLKADPVLHEKEVVLVATDAAKPNEYDCRKVGDGSHKFSALPLLGYDCLPATGTSATQPMSQKATTEAINAQATALEKLRTDINQKSVTQDSDILALQKAVWPLDVTFGASATVVKAGAEASVILSWSISRKGRDVTAQAAIELDSTPLSGSSRNMAVNLAHAATRQFTLKATFEGIETTRTCTVRGTLPTYFGTVASGWTPTAAAVKALTELTIGSRQPTRTAVTLNDSRIVLAYPKDFGALTSVKDGNGYETLTAYTRSELTIDGHAYYCYLLTTPVTATAVTQSYS